MNLYAYCNSSPIIYSDPSGFAKKKGKPNCDIKEGNGPYSHLQDGKNVGEGKDFTAAQKKKIYAENAKRNGGKLKSDVADDPYQDLVKAQKSKKGIKPNPAECQVDHIIPKSKGGTNSFKNAQVTSRKYNRDKWDK